MTAIPVLIVDETGHHLDRITVNHPEWFRVLVLSRAETVKAGQNGFALITDIRSHLNPHGSFIGKYASYETHFNADGSVRDNVQIVSRAHIDAYDGTMEPLTSYVVTVTVTLPCILLASDEIDAHTQATAYVLDRYEQSSLRHLVHVHSVETVN